jgi:hypothetical protein
MQLQELGPRASPHEPSCARSWCKLGIADDKVRAGTEPGAISSADGPTGARGEERIDLDHSRPEDLWSTENPGGDLLGLAISTTFLSVRELIPIMSAVIVRVPTHGLADREDSDPARPNRSAARHTQPSLLS